MFTITITLMSGRTITLKKVGNDVKKDLESRLVQQTVFSHNNGSSTTLVNTALVESVVVSGTPLTAQ